MKSLNTTLKKQSLFLSILLLVVIFYPQVSPTELDKPLGTDELIQSPQINRAFPSGDDTEQIMLINWNGNGVVDDNWQHIVCLPLTPPCVIELKPNIMISGLHYPVHQDWVVRCGQIN